MSINNLLELPDFSKETPLFLSIICFISEY